MIRGALACAAVLYACTHAAYAGVQTRLLESAGNTGHEVAIAVDGEGRPVVAFASGTTDAWTLKLITCTDIDCSSTASHAILHPPAILESGGIAVPPDGRPAVAYLLDGAVRFIKCADARCVFISAVRTLPGSGRPSIALGAGGLPVLAMTGASVQHPLVHIVRCTVADCGTSTEVTFNLRHLGRAFVATDGAGIPVVSVVADDGRVHVAKCLDAACAATPAVHAITPPESASPVARVAVPPDGFPVVAYLVRQGMRGKQVRVARCRSPDCSDGVTRYSVGEAHTDEVSLAVGANGFPLVSFEGGTDTVATGLRVVSCGDAECSRRSFIGAIDPRPGFAQSSAMAVGPQGRPVFAYQDPGARDLWFARCGAQGCADAPQRAALGQGDRPMAALASRETNSLVLVDTESHAVVGTIEGLDHPESAAFSPDGRTLVTSGQWLTGELAWIDLSGRRIEDRQSHPAISLPGAMTFSQDGRRLFVLATGSHMLVKWNRETASADASTPVGYGPRDVELSPDGKTLAVSAPNSSIVVLVDVASMVVTASFQTGSALGGLAFSPDGSRLYVAAGDPGRVLEIDMRVPKLAAEFAHGDGAVSVAHDGANTLYVGRVGGVHAYDTNTRQGGLAFALPGRADGLSMIPGESILYVMSQDSGYLWGFDLATRAAIGSLRLTGSSTQLNGFVSPKVRLDPMAIEYFHPNLGHYFVTSIPAEVQALDTAAIAGWTRTGEIFNVYDHGAGYAEVCRFFTTAFPPKSSHFYTPLTNECDIVKTNPDWIYEGIVFEVRLPSEANCPVGTTPLYRLYNDGQGGAPNHRYTTKTSIRDQMVAAGFIFEGATGCVPK